jgi:P-type conjugative transfer ATPase TrbB
MQLIESRLYDAVKQTLGKEVLGLLDDDSVIEILRNANGALCIERLGKDIEEVDCSLSDRSVESLIRLLAANANEVCNDKNPSLAIKLPYWHARFQGLLPPIVDAPSFSIRKHAKHIFPLDEYLESGSISPAQYDSLLESVRNRENIIISGGTGSGKTTLANAILAKMIETGDRIITVEDTPELRLSSKKGLQIFTKSNIGYGSQQAIKDILRLRPDRIVLGELRDGTCLDLIKAWNTGHCGGLTTVHANSCQLAIRRIESLIAEVSVNVPHELISQTVNLLIQIKREGPKRIVSDMKRINSFKNQEYFLEEIGGRYEKSKADDRARCYRDVVYLS